MFNNLQGFGGIDMRFVNDDGTEFNPEDVIGPGNRFVEIRCGDGRASLDLANEVQRRLFMENRWSLIGENLNNADGGDVVQSFNKLTLEEMKNTIDFMIEQAENGSKTLTLIFSSKGPGMGSGTSSVADIREYLNERDYLYAVDDTGENKLTIVNFIDGMNYLDIHRPH
jgi:hypothetical protein